MPTPDDLDRRAREINPEPRRPNPPIGRWSGSIIAPGNTNPERDARGISVVSDPATAPAGFNEPAGVSGPIFDRSQPPALQPATESYPACSRTVTDNCVQTYERGSRRPH